MTTCGQCQNFTQPAAIYERNSMGACSVWDKWITQFKGRNIPAKEHSKNYAMLGGKIFFTDIERKCERYTQKSHEIVRSDSWPQKTNF
jgi:hypothetical protein